MLVLIPVLLYLVLLSDAWQRGIFAIDFEQTLLPAAKELASGNSPYPAYGYPPLVAFGLLPFAVLPGAAVIFTALLVAGVFVTLRLLGVADWRCYGAAFLWAPVFHGVQTANVTILLLLGMAVAWHYRERPKATAVACGVTIAAKIICWPLLVWLASTRRTRTAIVTVLVGGGVTLALWATLGFSGLVGYPSSLDRLSDDVSPDSYTVKALVVDLGLPTGAGTVLWIALSIATLGACIIVGRRGDDRLSFSLAVLAAVIASPIVWLHSFLLLLAPVALYRPRFSAVWLLPALLWAAAGTGNGAPWQTGLVLAVSAVVFAWAVGPRWSRPTRNASSGPGLARPSMPPAPSPRSAR